MVSPKTQKIFVITIVLLLLAFLGYKLLTEEPEVLKTDEVLSDTEIAGQDILALVEKLKVVSIDQAFFSDSLFNNLKDLTQQIFPEVYGRPNPFAVIGSDPAPYASNISTTTDSR